MLDHQGQGNSNKKVKPSAAISGSDGSEPSERMVFGLQLFSGPHVLSCTTINSAYIYIFILYIPPIQFALLIYTCIHIFFAIYHTVAFWLCFFLLFHCNFCLSVLNTESKL